MKPERDLKQISIITFFLVMSLTTLAQVQELESVDLPSHQITEITDSETDEKPGKLLLNPEKDSVVRINSSKSKVIAEPVKAEKLKEEAEQEDSILSFNFIYYIIKKFKFSDIVDH
jgi:hypothetical protein